MEDTSCTVSTQSEDGNTNSSSDDGKRYRNWFFTWNNYDTADILYTENTILSMKGQYVFQEETGKEGTKHLQGTILLKNGKTFTAMKSLFMKCHLEVIRNKKSSVNYCCKDDTRTGKVYTNIKSKVPIKDYLDGVELYGWQKELTEILNGEVDTRKIYWYWEQIGNVGKTQFCRHLCIKNKDYLYLTGKASDMKYTIATAIENGNLPVCILMDFTRSQEEYISYQGIEEIKNGIFYSSKYKGNMVIFNIPHVIVFSNFRPEMFRLSIDRWDIREIATLDGSVKTAEPF